MSERLIFLFLVVPAVVIGGITAAFAMHADSLVNCANMCGERGVVSYGSPQPYVGKTCSCVGDGRAVDGGAP